MNYEREKRLNKLYIDSMKNTSTNQLLVHGLNSIDSNEYSNISKYPKWLRDTIILVENIPICVSISSREKINNVQHPLIYVNKSFEKMTKYNREEIIGKNCNFLQGNIIDDNELETKNEIANILSNGLSCKFLITNYKKDGSKFRNLLSLFPIKNILGEICYYMGFQTDLTDPKTPYNYIMLIDDLLDVINHVIDEEEQYINPLVENVIKTIGDYKNKQKITFRSNLPIKKISNK